MYIKYVKYITCITCIIYSFSDYVDSDFEDPPIKNRDDDGGPPQDQDPLEFSMRALKTRVLALTCENSTFFKLCYWNGQGYATCRR